MSDTNHEKVIGKTVAKVTRTEESLKIEFEDGGSITAITSGGPNLNVRRRWWSMTDSDFESIGDVIDWIDSGLETENLHHIRGDALLECKRALCEVKDE